MGVTSIPWADYTFNPWRGCTKVSQGCAHCYAEAMDRRQLWGDGCTHWGDAAPRIAASELTWKLPHTWNRSASMVEAYLGRAPRVFCGSMCDVAEEHPDTEAPRRRLVSTIEATPALDWLLLSKRPANFGRLFPWRAAGAPPRNVWLGTSVENEDPGVIGRVRELRRQRAAIRFLSVEPHLSAVGLPLVMEPCAVFEPDEGARCRRCGGEEHDTPGSSSAASLPGIDWVIVGGESGPKARPCAVNWIADVVRQCRSAGVAAFVKQLGSRPFVEASDGARFAIGVKGKGEDPSEWPRGFGLFADESGIPLPPDAPLRGLPWSRWPSRGAL